MIQVYAPTSSHSNEEVEETYEEIANTIKKSNSHFKIIMGDFEAKVGKKYRNDGEKVGHFCLGERNEQGTKPVQFCKNRETADC